jgi:hypothetical protein
MASPPPIEELRQRLGLPSAPLVLAGLRAVQAFFTQRLHVAPGDWLSYLRGIDFHHPVEEVMLRAPVELVRHKPPLSRPKPFLYFAKVGSSPMHTGTNFPSVTFERYRLTRPIPALQSIASAIAFGPADRVVRPGGAVQYIVAAADFSALAPK